MLAGMDIARLNFSHGGTDEFLEKIRLIRKLNTKYKRHLRILGDLQGHRIRIGSLKQPVELKKKQIVTMAGLGGRSKGAIPFDYRGSLNRIKKGSHIFIDDGNIDLEVTGHKLNALQARVIAGGLLKGNKGVNIPQAKLEFGRISAKDKADIAFCEEQAIDYIAQSFVRSENDVKEVRALLSSGSGIRTVAKIENSEGIKNIDSIIKASDGIMIARGDMGVSLPIYEIPVIQKVLINKCNLAGKFAITATQMLESMTENFRPTRAEVTDVANAIIDGTDFVMLSAESAVGKYPVQATSMMNDIIKFTEGYLARGR